MYNAEYMRSYRETHPAYGKEARKRYLFLPVVGLSGLTLLLHVADAIE
jgi:hypothetical protein